MDIPENTGYREINNLTKDVAPAGGIEPLLEKTTGIVATYLGNKHVAPGEIPTLIGTQGHSVLVMRG